MILRQLVEKHETLGSKAPIVEALIDLKVDPSPEVTLDALRSFNDTLNYPRVEALLEWESQLRLEPDLDSPAVTSKHGVRGYIFSDESRQKVLQVRRDGFTFSQLAPYTSWEALRDEAKMAWLRYVEVARPTGIQQISLKYIDRLSFPAGQLELTDWFRLHPETPKEFGAINNDFLVRLAFCHPDEQKYSALVALGPDRNSSTETIFFLDISVWVKQKLSIDEEIWSVLENLRRYKNDLFFGSLTPHTLERLKQQ